MLTAVLKKAQTNFLSSSARLFATTTFRAEKALPPRPKVSEDDIEENFVKGTGPGGQKINKTSSAVQLIHRPTGIIIKCQETRSRTQNRKLARRLLADRIDLLEKGDDSRIALKADKAKKKKASADKKKRRKYKKLEDSKLAPTEDSNDFDSDTATNSGLDSPTANSSTSAATP